MFFFILGVIVLVIIAIVFTVAITAALTVYALLVYAVKLFVYFVVPAAIIFFGGLWAGRRLGIFPEGTDSKNSAPKYANVKPPVRS